MKDTIIEALKKALAGLGIEAEPVLDFPADLAHGDYSSNVALAAAKSAKKNPKALAEEIVAKLGAIDGISKIEVAGPGFINFTLAREVYSSILQKTEIDGDRWGSNDHVKGYKVMVEYTDPNPFKEFHIGHLMSNTIGESIARLVEFCNATVKRANYQGDVGLHVAKAIWAMTEDMDQVGLILNANAVNKPPAELLGKWYAFGAKAYEANKEKIDEINKLIYKILAGEKTDDPRETLITNLYGAGKKLSLSHFEDIYRILGTKFDFYFFESETTPKGIALVKAHPEVFEESEGAIIYKGEKVGLHTRVFITSKGLPTYEAKDLGLAEMKSEKWSADLSITITASEQSAYFAVMLAALKEIEPELAQKIKHVSHGMMRLPTGKMSSRTGDVITGESLLADLSEAALTRAKESRADNAESLASSIAVAAIKYQVLKQTAGKDIVFDKDQALSLNGDSGPYLQYAYARAMSVLAKADTSILNTEYSIPASIPVFERLLPRFPDVVYRAAKEYEPHYVTTYLTELAGAFNSWYASDKIIGSVEEGYKLALVRAFAQTMKNGLWLLGIAAPEKM